MSTKIEKAVAKVNARPKTVVLQQVTIAITQEPIVVKASGELSFTRGDKASATDATLLLWDPKVQGFRPVLTPPGTSWELVEKKQGPSLWTPGRQA